MKEQKEFKIEGYDFTFRMAKMNALDALAVQTQFQLTNAYKTREMFSTILEFLEVKAGEKWIPVKIKGEEVYTPSIVEEDIKLASALIVKFREILVEVF